MTGVQVFVTGGRDGDVRESGSEPGGGRRTVAFSELLDFLLPRKRTKITSATITQIHPLQPEVLAGLGGAGGAAIVGDAGDAGWGAAGTAGEG